jgi:hypothetical protein
LLQWLVLAGERGHGKFNDVKHEILLGKGSDVQVFEEPRKALPASGVTNGGKMHLFEMVVAGETSFLFGTSTKEAKEAWVYELRGALAQST